MYPTLSSLIRFAFGRFAVATLVICGAASLGRAAETRVISLQREFEAFWGRAEGKPFDEQLKVWDEVVEKPHQRFYDAFVWEKPVNAQWEKRKRRVLTKSFAAFPELYSEIGKAFAAFPGTLDTQIKRFQRVFPEAQFPGPIYGAPVGVFNGKGAEGGDTGGMGEPVLAFGIDVITSRHDNVGVLYSHELFHMYHATAAGFTEQLFATRGKLTLLLWMEGFATYVSGQLNPSEPDGVLLMDESLGRIDPAERPWIAAEFLRVAEEPAVDRSGAKESSRWFGSGVASIRADLPSRCGYWLGLAVVRELARTHPVTEMVRWDADTVHREVVATLRKLASAGGAPR